MPEDTMDTAVSQTSTTLLHHVAGGENQSAEQEFYDRYSRLARLVVVAAGIRSVHDIDDVVQETMAATMQALRSGRYQRERGAFRPWFKTILRHKLADARQAAARAVKPSEGLTEVPDTALPPDEAFDAAFDAQWRAEALVAALHAVKDAVQPSTWLAFQLTDRQGWTGKEAADHLGISRSAVYLATLRVRRLIKKQLAKY